MAEKKKSIKDLKTYFIGNSKDRLFLFLVYASILTALFYNSGLLGVYYLMLLSIVFSKNTLLKFSYAYKNVIVILATAFFILYLVGLVYTDNIPNGNSKLEGKVPFLVLPLFMFSLKKKFWQHNFSRIVNFFLAATILATFIMLARAIFMIVTTGNLQMINPKGELATYFFMYTELSGWLAHPGYYTLIIALAIFLFLWKIIKNGSSIKLWSWVTYLLIFMFLLMGRGSFLAFSLVLGVGFIAYIISTKKYKLIALTTVPAIAIGLFLFLAPAEMSKRITKPLNLSYDITEPILTNFNGATVRLAEWYCATDAIKNNFWLGTGSGDHQDVLNKYYEKHNFIVGLSHSFNCHNQFLETQLTIGVLGSIILLLLIIYVSFIAIKTRNYLLLASIWLVYLGMLTESLLERQLGSFLLLFFTSFFYLAFVNQKQTKKEPEEIDTGLPF